MLQYLMTYLRTVLPQEEGQDLAEYALLIGLIALVVLVGVGLLGTNLNNAFSGLAGTISGWFGGT